MPGADPRKNSATIDGTSPQDVLAAPGIGLAYTIYAVSVSGDTAGKITLSDTKSTYFTARVAIGTPAYYVFPFGRVQDAVNLKLTVTNSGGGNVSCTISHDGGQPTEL